MTTPPSNPPQNAAEMIQTRRRDSDTKRARVLATLERMQNEDVPITFASVARHARVSTWLVYAPGVREHIDHARAQQTDPIQQPFHTINTATRRPTPPVTHTLAVCKPISHSRATTSAACAPNATSSNSN